MDALASIDDLEERYRALTSDERIRAQQLLVDASAMLLTELKSAGKTLDETDEVQQVAVKAVCCNMVKRVIANGLGADYTQTTVSAGDYSQSATFANPTGDMYITKQERRMLGIPRRKSRLIFLHPAIGEDDD